MKDKQLGSLIWEYVPNGSCTVDKFPKVPGPMGSPKVMRPQMEVIKGFKYSGHKGDLLKAYLRLHPQKADLDAHVRQISAAMKLKTQSAAH